MSTTVHIPPVLLSRVDARARARGMSRNRLIIEALERNLDARADWSPELVNMLADRPDPKTTSAFDGSMREVARQRRSRRRAPELGR